ncbi:hypothetical protein AOL_s00088g26 [Orbilia oligospora ATCC 24927]|uniref:Uncharacterized protein n=2 Tax=Orbilia oligospora TaxID=2813651 RepID=G1XHR3_ARTOA|nr:hypothetical protein AOL_s00088g26 [Orbilia oligospora ATCC 24927]EGX47311.1 hypothetical protein AOL_s00088g26 [Orbilia oligospora ATCC 24927]KAF3270574.1 hypothetical protein TWF970_010777 [Orbilia oligospora]
MADTNYQNYFFGPVRFSLAAGEGLKVPILTPDSLRQLTRVQKITHEGCSMLSISSEAALVWSFLVGDQNIPNAEEVKQKNELDFLTWVIREAKEKGEVVSENPDGSWRAYKFPVQWQSGTPRETTQDCYVLLGDYSSHDIPSLHEAIGHERLLACTERAIEVMSGCDQRRR